jgi:pyridoxal phosphate enzyme (YggS family)
MDFKLEHQIEKKYKEVCNKISEAALRCNRKPEEIKIIVVTKKQPLEKIQAAINVGIKVFGENYPEEAELKIQSITNNSEIEWHMIGHLQSRKIPIVCNCFSYLHSLDSLQHASKLDQSLDTMGKKMLCLLEFNLANEQTKSGWRVGDLDELNNILPDINSIYNLQQIKILGLMAMPPLFHDPARTRSYAVKLRKIRDQLTKLFPDMQLDQLSIGTSSDYQIAIEEGSTMVRIGEAILGPRNYQHPG